MSEPTGFEHHGEGSNSADSAVAALSNAQPAGSGNSAEPSPNTPADNPAWADFLGIIPSGLHEPVKQHLRKWDAGVDERFRTVHSEYEPYKWAKENQISGEDLQQAYGFWRQANDNPQFVWETLGQHFNFGAQAPQQGQPGTNAPVPSDEQITVDDFDADSSPFDIEQHPAFQALKQQNEQIMAQFEQRAQEELAKQQEAEATKWADGLNERLGREFPNVDATRVWQAAGGLFAANPNVDPEQIVLHVAQQEQAYIDRIRSTPAPGASAPQVMSPSGSSPVVAPITSLNSEQRKAAAVEYLRAAGAN